MEFTIRKGSDGTCDVTNVKNIPLWVHRYTPAGSTTLTHNIVPIADALRNPSAFGLNNSTFGVTHAKEALAMTNDTFKSFKAVLSQKMPGATLS